MYQYLHVLVVDLCAPCRGFGGPVWLPSFVRLVSYHTTTRSHPTISSPSIAIISNEYHRWRQSSGYRFDCNINIIIVVVVGGSGSRRDGGGLDVGVPFVIAGRWWVLIVPC